MKLSISNIAWSYEHDEEMYAWLSATGFTGLEIAPTRIFPEKPYEHIKEAEKYASALKRKWGISISSMQSIWFGKSESIFKTKQEREILIEYTKTAIDFAEVAGCHNLVFGCPRNRVTYNNSDYEIGIDFFRELGEYAYAHDTVLAIEPNPPIYNTNFINTTDQAFEIVRDVDSAGFKVNLDFGTIIENGEKVEQIAENISYVNHIHISEPGLPQIFYREEHSRLRQLIEGVYNGYISIEMKNLDNLNIVKRTAITVKEVFG
ncbi:MAG: sugar phosphate isomerase/epimerase family protein [Bacillota bacterium]|nr:sugar phosphate isomerase/epimerase family protein [Bacillota bacterium]